LGDCLQTVGDAATGGQMLRLLIADDDPGFRRSLRRVLERDPDTEVIGEAAGRVSPETRQRISSIPWPLVVGIRNRLIHGYDTVDLDDCTKAGVLVVKRFGKRTR
jgi:DNA-binding LytR/AlgR family response regulator